MTRTTAPRLTAYAGLAAFGLLAAVALGRPELAVLAAPFALVSAVGLGTQTAFDFHFRLRPVLVEIARGRLAARGIKLEDAARARSVLGEEAWELLRPEREPPRDRNAPGLATDELGRLVAALERIK